MQSVAFIKIHSPGCKKNAILGGPGELGLDDLALARAPLDGGVVERFDARVRLLHREEFQHGWGILRALFARVRKNEGERGVTSRGGSKERGSLPGP